jgi:lipopolysaccharide export system ATP-binding protein
MQILETVEISKSYRGRRVVDDVSVRVERGEIVGLLGPNGAGKTTSFYMVVGLISPDSGKVLRDGADLTNMPMFQRARLGISYLPQEASIFRKLTVEENLMAILQTRRMTGRERREKMNRLIEQMGLETVAKATCSQEANAAESKSPAPSLLTPAFSCSTSPSPESIPFRLSNCSELSLT